MLRLDHTAFIEELYKELVGKVVQDVGFDGRTLAIRTTMTLPSGHKVRETFHIMGVDGNGDPVKDWYPMLQHRKDVNVVMLTGAGLGGGGKA